MLTALAQELIDLEIVPDVDDRLRNGKFREGITTAEIVADAIGLTCELWDRLMEGVQSKSVEVTDLGRGRPTIPATGDGGRGGADGWAGQFSRDGAA